MTSFLPISEPNLQLPSSSILTTHQVRNLNSCVSHALIQSLNNATLKHTPHTSTRRRLPTSSSEVLEPLPPRSHTRGTSSLCAMHTAPPVGVQRRRRAFHVAWLAMSRVTRGDVPPRPHQPTLLADSVRATCLRREQACLSSAQPWSPLCPPDLGWSVLVRPYE